MATKKKLCPKCIITTFVLMVAALLAGIYYSKHLQEQQNAELNQLQNQLTAATVLPSGSKSIPDFELFDQDSQPVNQDSFKGRWSFLFFGYTNCPDICPITMTIPNQFREKIQDDAINSDTDIVFVSVDPQRDSAAHLKRYMGYFDKSFKGYTGEKTQIDRLADPLGIFYRMVENPNSAEDYIVDHSASILLVDPAGDLRAIFGAPHKPAVLATDYRLIRNAFNAVD